MNVKDMVKENKGMAALLGVLIIGCGVMLWLNLQGDGTPPPKPVQIDQIAPTPELKKQYERQKKIEDSMPPPKRPPSGA